MSADRWHGRRVAVTGGSSLLGSFLVEQLVERGAQVRVASRRTERGFLAPLGDAVEWKVGDVADPSFCRAFLDAQDELLHLASHRRNVAYHLSHRQELIERNEAMTTALLAALEARPLPVTFFSTAMVGMTADAERAPDGYVAAKALCERQWKEASDHHGFPLLIIRPVSAYGPRDTFPQDGNVIPSLIVRCAGAEKELVVWGSGKQQRSFVYAPDAAPAVLALLEAGATGMQHLGPPDRVSIGELAALIRDLVQPGLPICFDLSRPEGPSFPAPPEAHPSLRGFPWTGLEEGLRRTVEWYRQRVGSE